MRTAVYIDRGLLFTATTLLIIGLIMVESASIYGAANGSLNQPLYYFKRQFIFALTSLIFAGLLVMVPLSVWQRMAPKLLVGAIVLLVLVFIPGIGKEVNNSRRWLSLGFVNVQAVEIIKLVVIVYAADYLQRHQRQMRQSFLQPFKLLIPFVPIAGLLILQPDMGSVVIVSFTMLVMMFLGGMRLDTFIALIVIGAGLFGLSALMAQYRMLRLQSFMDPWAEPFGSGFQLTQALIAFGRGEWLGVGLGDSMQKLFYLPEAHTDFLYSILAEELGLVGAITVLALFLVFIWRALTIGRAAEKTGKLFSAYIAYGIAVWLGLQAFVNMGVNMGVLPTKGLTLPLMSYGGSSLVVSCVAIALLFRVDFETRLATRFIARTR